MGSSLREPILAGIERAEDESVLSSQESDESVDSSDEDDSVAEESDEEGSKSALVGGAMMFAILSIGLYLGLRWLTDDN